MTQQVTVVSVKGNMARVRYKRPTACHGDCDHCGGGCGSMAAGETLVVDAENLIGAGPGDSVIIQGKTAKVVSAILFVYILPVVLFFLGYYATARFFRAGAIGGILGFALGLLLAVLESKRQKKNGTEISFQIIAYA